MDIGGRSIRWLLAAALVAVAGLLEATAVALVWRPCAGSMLNGSILLGYAYPTEFTQPCLAAMDSASVYPLLEAGQDFTWAAAAGTTAAILLALSWLAVLPALAVTETSRLVAALPSLLVLGGAGTSALWPSPAGTGWATATWLLVLASLAIPPALLALAGAGVRGGLLLRATVVLLAATAPGAASRAVDYLVSIFTSDANWDTPPGTGWVTATLCLIAAVVTFVGWSRSGAPQAVASYAGAQP